MVLLTKSSISQVGKIPAGVSGKSKCIKKQKVKSALEFGQATRWHSPLHVDVFKFV